MNRRFLTAILFLARSFRVGWQLTGIMVLFLSLPGVMIAGESATPTHPNTPASPDPVRQELQDLRQEVDALRFELAAFKALLAEARQSAGPKVSESQPADHKFSGESVRLDGAATATKAAAQASLQTSEDLGSPVEHPRAGTAPVEVASISAPPVVTPAAQQPSDLSPTPDKPSLTKLLNNRVTLGGYGSVRFETNDVSPGNFFPSGSPSGFTFRRFVLTTDAQIAPRLRIYSETEFERLLEIEVEKSVRRDAGGLKFQQATEGNSGGEISIEQIWGQFDFAKNHGLRVGVVLPPLGRFNIHHDDDYWDLPRRTLVDRDAPVLPLPAAWRELGAGLVGTFDLPSSWKLNYQFYVLNGTTLNFNPELTVATRAGDTTKLEVESELNLASGAVDGSQGARAVAWRAAFSPKLGAEFAFSGYHGRYTPSFLSVKEPINSLGFDGNWRYRGFEVEGEFIYTSLSRVNRVLENLATTALVSSSEAEIADVETEVELAAKGLARTRKGFWTDFKYHWRPALLRNSFLGRDFEDPQIIPIARYERVWLNRNLNELTFANGSITNLDQENLEQDRVSLGVNYRPVPQFGIQMAYEHNERRGGSRLIFPAVQANSTNGFLAGVTFAF